jgi:hypothetical protein
MCVREEADCGTMGANDKFYQPMSDEIMGVKMWCPCYETRTGSCYKFQGHVMTCATSQDVCPTGETWLDAKKTKDQYGKDCFLCAKDDANDGDLTTPAYMAVAAPADPVTEANNPCVEGYAAWDGNAVTKASGCSGSTELCHADGRWLCKGLIAMHNNYASPFADCSDATLVEGRTEKEMTQLLSECCNPGKGVCGDSKDGATVAGSAALAIATLALVML